jgi:selenium-dependent molybdenum hydroxylase system protein, yqeB family
MIKDILIICRGAGDLATGIIHRLHRAGFKVLALETKKPAAIRRQVSFCEAVYDKEITIEGVKARLITSLDEMDEVIKHGVVPVIVDPKGESIAKLRPDIVVDAIIAKKNFGTFMDMAPLVIGVGPGFTAGEDVDIVVETMRGHNLARIIDKGQALVNTGIPGNIGGYTSERVIHAEAYGFIKNICHIGDVVKKGDEIARIYEKYDNNTSESGFQGEYVPVNSTISGIIRGIIRDGFEVTEGFKIADIDPREGELKNCFTISDKSRSIGGSVLEAVCSYVSGIN